ncbi:plasmid mobilization protein [Methylobacterium guangdongense]|uniref:plasmid mobilization protein n=1 Tax=Methylobacterium guangdongense TaxID=3138811 RepID=UPI00399D159C
MRKQDQAKRKAIRRQGEAAQTRREPLRTKRINLDVSEAEWRAIATRAQAVRMALRAFIREAALRRASASNVVVPPSAAELDAAAVLTAVAGDLAQLAEAAAAGIITGVLPDLLHQLHDAAHLLGLRIIGAAPDAS